MKKWIARLAVVLALAGSIVGINSIPASASFSDCTNGQGCAWIDINGGGPRQNIVFSQNGTTCHNFSIAFDNAISSTETLYGSGYGINLYDSYNCGHGGQGWIHQPAFTTKNWTDGCFIFCFNDVFSSYKICNDSAACATSG